MPRGDRRHMPVVGIQAGGHMNGGVLLVEGGRAMV